MSFSRFDIPGYNSLSYSYPMMDSFVKWITADERPPFMGGNPIVEWIVEKTTGVQAYHPPERSGFKRACTIATRVGMLFGAGIAAAGATFLVGKGIKAYGNSIITNYTGKTPTFVANSPEDGSALCDAGSILKRYAGTKYHYVVPILDKCSNVQESYNRSVLQGQSIVAAGEYVQLGARIMYLTLTTPAYTAYALPKRLFESLVAVTPDWKIGQGVNHLFELTRSTAENIIGKS